MQESVKKNKRTIDSKPFGKIEIEEKQIFCFPLGILAFEDLTEYALLHSPENSGFSWLQSLQDSSIAFILFPLDQLVHDYQPEILQDELKENLKIDSIKDCEVWNIVTIPGGDAQAMTINEQGPILLSRKKNLGGQFISLNEEHSVRAPFIELIEKYGGNS